MLQNAYSYYSGMDFLGSSTRKKTPAIMQK